MLTLTKEIVQSFLQSDEQFPISLEDVVEWLGYAAKRNAKDTLVNNFQEGVEYLRSTAKTPNPLPGRPSDLFYLTIDTFKQLCMMSGTDKGREVRLQYLQYEKELKALRQVKLPTHSEALRGWADALDKNEKLEAQIEADAPAVEGWKRFLDAGGTFSIQMLAKLFNVSLPGDKKPLGEHKFFKMLRDESIFFKKGKHNEPYQQYLVNNWFQVKMETIPSGFSVPVIRITAQGVECLLGLLMKRGYIVEPKDQ